MMGHYSVLARKWRPRSFADVVGQTPVVQALTNALTQNRLHHAYLFTGTRGVGKTSIARLFAKALNCEQGITATPCNQCSTCEAINQGRFLDLLEIDAASRTKVEDTRDLLDNVQYAPTQGRYKVYLIDEVHMLSNHSFNALLKTLEEPPEHVKFLLATTDPQRLPVTILSRCLQFHLKNLSVEQLAKQLAHIAEQEHITYEAKALTYLAQAAQGSMRDALSLTDQAIAYGNGKLSSEEVKNLLGHTEPALVRMLLTQIADRQAESLMQQVSELVANGADFPMVLEELLSLLHQIAVQQVIPGFSHDESLSTPEITALASRLTAEEVQLYYQIALLGRRDLPLAPTPRIGFEMVLLRILAFRPHAQVLDTAVHLTSTQKTIPAPIVTEKKTATKTPPAPAISEKNPTIESTPLTTDQWHGLLAQLNVQGMAQMVALNCTLVSKTHDTIHLLLDHQHALLLNPSVQQRLNVALNEYFQKPMQLQISTGKLTAAAPAEIDRLRREQQQEAAVAAIANDEHVKRLISQFDAKVLPDSIVAHQD